MLRSTGLMRRPRDLVRPVVGLLALSLAVTACSSNSGGKAAAGSDKTVTLRVAHTAKPTEAYQIGFEKFASEVQQISHGSIKVQIFPNSQLGDEPSVLKSVQSGSIAMATAANSTVANYLPKLHLFDMPFLFNSADQALSVTSGPIGKSFANGLADKGFVLLGYYYAGARNILNNQKPINSLADFKGMKIRVIPSDVNEDSFKAMGANPTPIEYSQLYTALQTHVVDAAEAANSNYYAQKFYEVAPNYAILHWQFLVSPVVMSKKIFDTLSAQQQQDVRKALTDSLQTEWSKYEAEDDAALASIKKLGNVKITQPDRQPWIDAVKPVWAKWAPTVGADNIQQITGAH